MSQLGGKKHGLGGMAVGLRLRLEVHSLFQSLLPFSLSLSQSKSLDGGSQQSGKEAQERRGKPLSGQPPIIVHSQCVVQYVCVHGVAFLASATDTV